MCNFNVTLIQNGFPISYSLTSYSFTILIKYKVTFTTKLRHIIVTRGAYNLLKRSLLS